MKALHHLQRWPVEEASGGWLNRHDQGKRTGPTDRVFPLASVTKPLLAYAVLIAVEEGTLSLDLAAGPDGSTVRHLLAHTSGLGDHRESPLARVGHRRIYSNAGFELLGELLASAAGMSTARYVREAVIEPLQLGGTTLEGSPAHGGHSCVNDLLLVIREWLRPTLLAPSTLAAATTNQFGALAGVLPGYGSQDPNPWGLGFELKGQKAPHWTGAMNAPSTFGHFGRTGTVIWVDPEAGVGCVALTNRQFGPWAKTAWPTLSDAVLSEALSELG